MIGTDRMCSRPTEGVQPIYCKPLFVFLVANHSHCVPPFRSSEVSLFSSFFNGKVGMTTVEF